VLLNGSVAFSVRQGVPVVQIYLLKTLIQRLSNYFIEEQETSGLSVAIATRKMNKPMIIEFAFRAIIDFPFVPKMEFRNGRPPGALMPSINAGH
jgi:hypothetical protein